MICGKDAVSVLMVDVIALSKVVSDLTGLVPVRLTRISLKSPSANFKAEFNGFAPLLVKCCPKDVVIAEVRHPLAMRVVAAKGELQDIAVWCCTWVEGHEMLFADMSEAEVEMFADDYESFRSAIVWDGSLLPPRDYGRCSESLKPIHGDLNRHNVLFRSGRIVGFLDYEEFRVGYPTEDLVRFVCTSAESHGLSTLMSRQRLLRNFCRLMKTSSYTEQEWVSAVRGFEKTKFAKGKSRLSRWWHSGLYRRLEECCRCGVAQKMI